MSAAEQRTPAPAGVSAPAEADVEELLSRLREEVNLASTGRGGAGTARAAAERYWSVSADRDLGSGPRAVVKRLLRKLMRWYVEPLAADQRGFNDAALKLFERAGHRFAAARSAVSAFRTRSENRP